MNTQVERAANAYRAAFGQEPAIVAHAPGRVNLIGDHTDYNGGWVLPCAVDRWVAVAMDQGPGVLISADIEQKETLSGCNTGTWAAYPRGVAWALADAGHAVPSFQAAYAGDVPRGSGLSSSAAIEVSTGVALRCLFDLGVQQLQLAQLCQTAENRFVGVKSGIMDQFISIFAQDHAAVLLDCRSLDNRRIPFDPEAAGCRLLVCNTGVDRQLATSGYNHRREVCEAAARRLGVDSLRDATVDDIERLSGEQRQYSRHVLSENARVLAAAEALESGDLETLGRLMNESHASLRDDFGVSTAQLDEFVVAAQEGGALGARLTGAGFGGCGVALVPAERCDRIVTDTQARYRRSSFSPPTFYVLHPVAGAVGAPWNAS